MVRRLWLGFIFIYINLGILTTLGAKYRIAAFCNNTIDLYKETRYFKNAKTQKC